MPTRQVLLPSAWDDLCANSYQNLRTLNGTVKGGQHFDYTLHGAKLTLPTSSTNWVPFVLKTDAACDLHTKATHVATRSFLAAVIAITVRLG